MPTFAPQQGIADLIAAIRGDSALEVTGARTERLCCA